MDTHHSSSVLPGAWSANWRDSQELVEIDQNKPSSQLEWPKPNLINPAHIELPLSETKPPHARMDIAECSSLKDNVSSCSDSEDGSILSDDFYSILDDDESSNAMLLPPHNGFNGPIDKGKGRAQDVQHPVVLLKENLHSSVLSSRLHEGQDVTFPNDVPSELYVPQAAHPPAGSEQPIPNADGSLLKNSSVPRTLEYAHEASASSRANSVFDDDDCSSGSVRFKKYESDDDSVYSNYAGPNYDRVRDMVNRLGSGRSTMSTSVESTPRGPTQSSSRLIDLRQINSRRIDPDNTITSASHSGTLDISHHDGNNPWTLSLDPTLSPTESSPSQISSGSFSLHSLNRESSQRRPLQSSFFIHGSRASSIRQSISGPQYRTGIQDSSRPTRQGLDRPDHSRRALPASQGIHSDIHPQPHDRMGLKPSNKNVLQKTKALCSKLKKFIVTKKPQQKREEQCTLGYLDTSVELPPPLPYLNSPPTPTSVTPSWSFDRLRPVKRIRKASTPPESTAKSKAPSIDNKNSYEYHARPKTLSEIKSSRRFSLPAFRASASQNYASR